MIKLKANRKGGKMEKRKKKKSLIACFSISTATAILSFAAMIMSVIFVSHEY